MILRLALLLLLLLLLVPGGWRRMCGMQGACACASGAGFLQASRGGQRHINFLVLVGGIV
jgi:hypothetical protein